MPSAEIITIGTEILLGEIVDTNAQYIARKLRDAGIDLYRKTTVGDNAQRIAQVIQEALKRCDIVITTGGLGPTVDDPTREAVALAFNVPTEFRPVLWEQIQKRFQRFGRQPTENNKRQAHVPQGALAVENPVGTAPAFIMETGQHSVIALPGVPSEMQYLLQNAILPYLYRRYHLTGLIKVRVLHTAGVGESQIDALVGDLEKLANPTIGLAAHSGQVDVRITAKASSEAEANSLIQHIEADLRTRLGDCIYGADQETLEEVALHTIQKKEWTLAVVEAGTGGILIQRLTPKTNNPQLNQNNPFRGGETLTTLPTPSELGRIAASYRQSRRVEACLGVAIYPSQEKYDVHIVLITPLGQQQISQPYGGPPEYAPRWALNYSLNLIRKLS